MNRFRRHLFLHSLLLFLMSFSSMAMEREFQISSKYLVFPVKNEAPKAIVTLTVEGEKVREFDIELASGEPDFWVFLDVAGFSGKQAFLHGEPAEGESLIGFDRVYQDDAYPVNDRPDVTHR